MTASVQAVLLILISLLAAATLACSPQETPTPTPDDSVPTQVFTQQDIEDAIQQTIEVRDLNTAQAQEEITLQTRTAEATKTSVESLIEAAAGMPPSRAINPRQPRNRLSRPQRPNQPRNLKPRPLPNPLPRRPRP